MKRIIATLMALIIASSVMVPMTAKAADTDTVYVSTQGKKYHYQDCRWIENSTIIPVTVADALKTQAAAAVPVATALTPQQIVEQAFAQYVAQGMTQDQALATVQANLPALLAAAQ